MSKPRKLPAALGIHLDVANRLWRTAMDQSVKMTNLTRPHWLALSAIADLGDGCTLKDISLHLNAEVSTMSRALLFLEKNQLIARIALTEDKRAKGVRMTAAGQEMLEQLDHSSQQARQLLLKGVSTNDLEAFYRVLFGIKHNAIAMLDQENLLPEEFALLASEQANEINPDGGS
ncbi:MarR family winged helix-turn-helix transcriptional regulator [Serratia proteamaculans]|uniref:MarR family winged helix-turn-helix transcriptional regulator n=1 Tax=Serratia proteamaculans TaxID=28151 RepID=UPI0039AEC2CA